MKRNQKCNYYAKNVLQCRILKASKTDVDSAKVQATGKYIQFDAWAGTGTNRYNVKAIKFVYLWYKFYFNRTEYLNLFVRFKNQNQKHVFPKILKVKTLFPS